MAVYNLDNTDALQDERFEMLLIYRKNRSQTLCLSALTGYWQYIRVLVKTRLTCDDCSKTREELYDV